ncbi:unnamed protein product, partial [Protopolystoma xenopodis]
MYGTLSCPKENVHYQIDEPNAGIGVLAGPGRCLVAEFRYSGRYLLKRLDGKQTLSTCKRACSELAECLSFDYYLLRSSGGHMHRSGKLGALVRANASGQVACILNRVDPTM